MVARAACAQRHNSGHLTLHMGAKPKKNTHVQECSSLIRNTRGRRIPNSTCHLCPESSGGYVPPNGVLTALPHETCATNGDTYPTR